MTNASDKSFGVVLCGLGRMGSIHLRNILYNKRTDLVYVIEADIKKAKVTIEENKLHETTKILHFDDINVALSDKRSTDLNKLSANQWFHHSDLITDLVRVISSQSEGLGKMALGIVKYAYDHSSQLIRIIWFAVSLLTCFVDMPVEQVKPENNLPEVISAFLRAQAVVIATPTHTHEELVNKALEAGKHVFCEKPLSLNLKSAMECYKSAESKGLVLLCAFNRRFDPYIKKLIENKDKVGKLQTIKICSRDSPRPSIEFLKISGGMFHDCLVHDLDLGRWLTGENPEVIHVLAHCYDPEIAALDDVDTIFTTLKFPSGILMHVESQRDCKFGYDQTLEIYGTKGSLINTNPRKSSLVYNGGQIQDDIHFSFVGRYAESYKNEIDHLIDVIEKKAFPCITANDTMHATLLSQIAEDSYREKRAIDVKIQSEKILAGYGLSEYINEVLQKE